MTKPFRIKNKKPLPTSTVIGAKNSNALYQIATQNAAKYIYSIGTTTISWTVPVDKMKPNGIRCPLCHKPLARKSNLSYHMAPVATALGRRQRKPGRKQRKPSRRQRKPVWRQRNPSRRQQKPGRRQRKSGGYPSVWLIIFNKNDFLFFDRILHIL